VVIQIGDIKPGSLLQSGKQQNLKTISEGKIARINCFNLRILCDEIRLRRS